MLASSLPRIIANVASILSSDVMNRGTTFVLYALVARHLGAHEFGQLSLALTLFYTFQVLAAAGLKYLVTREVAKDRAQTGRYLLNGSLVATGSSLVAVACLLAFVSLMDYAPDTASVILLLAFGLLPYALSAVCEAVFQAWERMHYIALANVPVNLARVGVSYTLLQQGYGLSGLMTWLMASYVLTVLIEWSLIRRFLDKPRLELDLGFARRLARSTVAFLGLDAIVALSASLTVILLSKLAGETEVGLYSASMQILVPTMLLLQSVVLSVYPLMCRQLDPSHEGLKRIAEGLAAILIAVVLPVTIALSVLSESVLLLLYGNRDFLAASGLLRLSVWGLVPLALTQVLGHVLVASHREKFSLALVAAQVVVNVLLGLVLIGQLGAVGAVVLALLDRLIGLGGHYLLVVRLVGRLALGRLVWRPVVAGAAMGAWLILARGETPAIAVVTAGVVYTSVLLLLTVLALGGPGQLRARYLHR